MESCLLAFNNDPEQVDSIFRAAHSIKGGAGTFGFTAVAAFTHNVETLLDEMRNQCIEVDDNIINLLLESVDILRNLLQANDQEPVQNTDQISNVTEKLAQILAQNTAREETEQNQEFAADNEEKGIDAHQSVQSEIAVEIDEASSFYEHSDWLIVFSPKLNMLQSGNEPMFIFDALDELGDLVVEPIIGQLPEFADFDGEQIYLAWRLSLSVDNVRDSIAVIRENITEVFEWVEDFSDIEVNLLTAQVDELAKIPTAGTEQAAKSEQEPLNATTYIDQANNVQSALQLPQSHPSAQPISEPAGNSKTSDKLIDERGAIEGTPKSGNNKQLAEISSVRVEIERLDELMNRVGELVVTQSMLSQAGLEVAKSGYHNQRLEQSLSQLESNTRDLQQDVMRMRMLPISFIFNRYLRLVHDISAKLGKKVALQITGEQTEIDKTVMEKIGDPLTHLIRNALDHGMETAEQRVASGKQAVGTIALNAYHQNGFIVIDVIDDGKGLDLQKIQVKAIQRGLISEDQQLTEDELKGLIFQPGFSTVDELSELSGRGVGMDVVMRNIQSLGGQINVNTEKGEGTSFSVRVPLTLAIIEGQLIQIGSENYVIPLVAIVETILVKQGDIKSLANQDQFINYREEYIHLIDLKELFLTQELHRVSGNASSESVKLIIVVESMGKKVGFIVDHLSVQQQFVVKPLETNFKKVPGLVGGTILGDGGVALILDSAGIISHCENLSKVEKVAISG